MQRLVFILGREPHLSVAEIAAVIGDGVEWERAQLSAEALVVPVTAPRHFDRSEQRERSGETSSDRDPSTSLGMTQGVAALMARLGGTIKIGEVWRTVARGNGMPHRMSRRSEATGVHPVWSMPEERVTEAIGKFILDQTIVDRKVHFGYSVYDLGGGAARVREVRESLRRGAAAQKAWLASHGRKVRWVTSREPTLSSVIVQKEKLLLDQNGVEVLVLVGADRILLARTLAVQPFEEWSRRDYGRPKRDARSGMLPPKLARAMINIALAPVSSDGFGVEARIGGVNRFRTDDNDTDKRYEQRHRQRLTKPLTLLDPFCGSGTILTEAMALGVPKIIGTDVSTKAVEDAKENVEWMRRRKGFSPSREGEREGEGPVPVQIQQCDIRKLSGCVAPCSVDAIVTEPYLGPPIGQQGSRAAGQQGELIAELHTLYLAAFHEFAKVLKPGGRIVFIVPVFREREIVLDITRDVARFGFHRIKPFPAPLHDHPTLHGKADLPYARPDQRVGRRILVLARTRGSIK